SSDGLQQIFFPFEDADHLSSSCRRGPVSTETTSPGLERRHPVPIQRRVEHCLDFGNRNDRNEATEQQEAGEKQTEASDERRDLNRRGAVSKPARREEIPLERADDDDESLEPHADVDCDGDDENGP